MLHPIPQYQLQSRAYLTFIHTTAHFTSLVRIVMNEPLLKNLLFHLTPTE